MDTGTRSRDPDGAECWNCGVPATSRRIDVETVIRGRPAAEGGPYRLFRCTACRAENGVLTGPRGGRMLYPLSGLEAASFFDRILSAAERARLSNARAWWAANRGRLERFRRGIDESPRVPPRTSSTRPPSPQSSSQPSPQPSPHPRPRVRAAALAGPRAVLGLPDDATADEVRRAFRRLAKRHHPDRASDATVATERFREIRAAYEEILRDLGA